jgi:regulator of protease activity HflC (stomatin/prohibitin superfamily)
MNDKVRIEIPTDNYTKARSASGSMSRNNGDVVASTLVGLTLDETIAIAVEVLDIPEAELRAKYAHLNVGQQRMNIGNRIRGAVNKMNKAEEQSGDSYLQTVASPFTDARAKREAAAAQAKAEKQAEREVKAAEKAAAKAAKTESADEEE